MPEYFESLNPLDLSRMEAEANQFEKDMNVVWTKEGLIEMFEKIVANEQPEKNGIGSENWVQK